MKARFVGASVGAKAYGRRAAALTICLCSPAVEYDDAADDTDGGQDKNKKPREVLARRVFSSAWSPLVTCFACSVTSAFAHPSSTQERTEDTAKGSTGGGVGGVEPVGQDGISGESL